MTSGSAVIVVPVLRRPHRVGPLVASVAAATPEPHRVLFVCSANDPDEIDAVKDSGSDLLVVPAYSKGDYARKINAGFARSDEPWVFLGADDLDFHPGWLPAALAPFENPAVGVVGTNDLGNARVMAGDHATHSLVRRAYIDQHGTIDEAGKVLHEGYWHEFVDDEFVATAKKRGAFAFAADSKVEHLHPLWGKSPTDPIYDAHARRMRAGRVVFNRRRRLWR